MSVVTVIVGMPLPIINLITTLVFLFANKSRGYFVRWHCMQALMTQVLLFFMNMAGVIWTLILIFSANSQFSNTYAAYCGSCLIQYRRIYRYCLCCGKGTQRDTRRVVVFW